MYSLVENTYRVIKTPRNPKPKLDPGFYFVNVTESIAGKNIFFNIVKRDPSLIRFTTGTVGDIVSKVEDFLKLETHAKYNALEIAHQMGILLHGPPGTGKTSVSKLIIQESVKKYDAIGLDISHTEIRDVPDVIKQVRKTNPDNPIILMIDEFENYVYYQHTPRILHFLDGSMREDKIVALMCTNFLDKIEERIKYRKSRIKHLYLVESLPIQVYKEFVKSKIKEMGDEDVSRFALLAEEQKLNIDQAKHAIIDYYINDRGLEEAITENAKFEENNE